MNKQTAIRKLAALGFEIDWSVTGPNPDGHGFSGVIDPIGRLSICGDCFGPSIQDAANAAEWYRLAIAEAQDHVGTLVICDDPECDMHAELPPATEVERAHVSAPTKESRP